MRALPLVPETAVFINPAVMRLPEHAHVIGGNGCYGGVLNKYEHNVQCGEAKRGQKDGILPADRLPPKYRPLRKAFLSDDAVGWLPPPCGGSFKKSCKP